MRSVLVFFWFLVVASVASGSAEFCAQALLGQSGQAYPAHLLPESTATLSLTAEFPGRVNVPLPVTRKMAIGSQFVATWANQELFIYKNQPQPRLRPVVHQTFPNNITAVALASDDRIYVAFGDQLAIYYLAQHVLVTLNDGFRTTRRSKEAITSLSVHQSTDATGQRSDFVAAGAGNKIIAWDFNDSGMPDFLGSQDLSSEVRAVDSVSYVAPNGETAFAVAAAFKKKVGLFVPNGISDHDNRKLVEVGGHGIDGHVLCLRAGNFKNPDGSSSPLIIAGTETSFAVFEPEGLGKESTVLKRIAYQPTAASVKDIGILKTTLRPVTFTGVLFLPNETARIELAHNPKSAGNQTRLKIEDSLPIVK